MTSKRNGDWGFYPISEDEATKHLTKKAKHKGVYTFAEGEATGHLHQIKVVNPDDLEIVKLANGDYIMRLKSDAIVTHPEHSLKADLLVKEGVYKLTQRREKDWFSMVTRKVID